MVHIEFLPPFDEVVPHRVDLLLIEFSGPEESQEIHIVKIILGKSLLRDVFPELAQAMKLVLA